ncbi:PucR family transcriptional regulator [Streptomyces sp. NPDC005071]
MIESLPNPGRFRRPYGTPCNHEHAERRSSHLLQTLRVFLDSGLSKTEAAQRLNVHPNTVSQRLRRIEVLAGLDLSAPTTIVEVGAALMLLDVAEGGQPT